MREATLIRLALRVVAIWGQIAALAERGQCQACETGHRGSVDYIDETLGLWPRCMSLEASDDLAP
jgi:hypothetical protein